jgi:replicative DNA helicase
MHLAQRGTPVALFSLEMTRQQAAQRLLAYQSGVPLDVVRGAREANREQLSTLAASSGALSELPIYPVEARQLTADKLRSSARWLRARCGVGAIVIDYLQLMAPPSRENRNQEIASLSRAVKLLALELEIPVLCLSQLNRESVKEGARRPRLSDLRDSGAIEQDSDVVLFLHDPNRQSESPAPGYEPDEKDLELIVAKQRQGPIGTIQLQFDGATQRFVSSAPL